jgi:hypothetical protein
MLVLVTGQVVRILIERRVVIVRKLDIKILQIDIDHHYFGAGQSAAPSHIITTSSLSGEEEDTLRRRTDTKRTPNAPEIPTRFC